MFFEKQGYVTTKKVQYIESSRTNKIDLFYLTPYDTKYTQISAVAGGIATDSTGTIEMEFPPGALPYDINVSATRFLSTKGYPVPIPKGQVFVDSIQFDPEHVQFNSDVTVRISNRHGFTAGTNIPFAFGMHEPDDLIIRDPYFDPGMAQVTADGQWIEFTTTHFSCPSFILPPGPPTGSGAPINSSSPFEQTQFHQLEQGKNTGAAVNRSDGNLMIDYTTIPYRSMGTWKDITITYNSATALPGATVAVELDNSELGATPLDTEIKISIEGVTEKTTYESVDFEARMAYFTGGTDSQLASLPSGTYYPNIDINNNYQANFFTSDTFGGPPVADTGVQAPDPVALSNNMKGAININNQQQSPFGWGWGIKGIQKLIKNPDNSILILEGGGDTLQYRPGHLPGQPAVTSVASGFNYPVGITYDPAGNIYITDTAANTIYKIAPETAQVALASIPEPTGIAWHPDGFLYAAAKTEGAIYKINMDGTTELFVTLPNFTPNMVQDIALDSQNNLYVYDTGGTVNRVVSHAIYKITPQKTIIKLISGQDKLLVSSMAISPDDELYLAFNNVGFLSCSASFIAKFTQGVGLSTVAANLNSPAGITFDKNGTLYLVDKNCATQNYHVYRIDQAGYKTEYLSDDLGVDLALPIAQLNHGIAIGQSGQLAILSTSSKQIFVEKGFDTLAPPSGEFSLLTPNPDNTYTLTAKNGTTTEFDQNGLMTSITDKNQNTTTYTYTPEQKLLSITDPVGKDIIFSYGASGKLKYIKDPANRTTSFQHDTIGNLTSIINPDASEIKYQYDTSHLLTTKTAPNNGTYTYTYNTMGRINKITDPEGAITQLSPGQMQGLINDIPAGEGTENTPSAITDPFGIIDLLFNTNGDLNQNKTDAEGALMEIINALGQ